MNTFSVSHVFLMFLGGFIGARLGIRSQIVAAYIIGMIYSMIKLSIFLSKHVAKGITNIFAINEAVVLSYVLIILFLLMVFIGMGKNLIQFFGSNILTRQEDKTFGLVLGAVLGWFFTTFLIK